MKVDFAFVCDYAETTGKMTAVGIGFDTIFAPKAPFMLSQFFLVIQLRASVVEAGEKSLEARLIDEDGSNIIPPIKMKFSVPKPAAGTESIARIALGFHNVKFPRYCLYSLHAVIEGHEMVRVPLKVSPPPQIAKK